jgi:hypothetical protein
MIRLRTTFVRPARLFLFYFPLSSKALTELLTESQISLGAKNYVSRSIRGSVSFSNHLLAFWAPEKETRNQKERREIWTCFPREVAFSQASSLLLLVDCSMTGFLISWALLTRLRKQNALRFKTETCRPKKWK